MHSSGNNFIPLCDAWFRLLLPRTQQLCFLCRARHAALAADGTMPCALCGRWVDRPRWQHRVVVNGAGVALMTNARFVVCARCCAAGNCQAISQWAPVLRETELERVNAVLEELLQWIASNISNAPGDSGHIRLNSKFACNFNFIVES